MHGEVVLIAFEQDGAAERIGLGDDGAGGCMGWGELGKQLEERTSLANGLSLIK